MAQIDEIKKQRLKKLEEIRQKGWQPYASSFAKELPVKEAREREGKIVTTAGKVVSLREHGNIIFGDLKDESGKIQLFFKKDTLGDGAYHDLRLIDIGDILGVCGEVAKTTAGEISIIPSSYTLLTKSILPPPHEWYGLKDIETRYRKRYLDLLVNEDEKQVFFTRSRVITLLRSYLDQYGFLEVETPVLQPIYGGAYAKPFVTHYNVLDTDFYLRIAVELYLKRLIVGGYEKIYELGKNFRNEGFSRAHNPEFTMLEFYWAYADYEKLMTFTEEMLTSVIQVVKGSLKVTFENIEYDFTAPWPRRTYRELFKEYMQLDINETNSEEALQKIIADRALLENPVVGYGQALDELYKKYVRPHLAGPLFVTEYPLEIKALAKAHEEDPTKAAGFQLVINGVEMVNAYNELNDPQEQRARWIEEMKLAERGGEDYQILDEDYIEALSYGMPPTAGWGMGIDRFIAFLTDKHTIKDVILFPTLRPEGQTTLSQAHQPAVSLTLTREKALEIIQTHLTSPNLINHSKAVEAAMRALAQRLGGNQELWGLAGILHDADWDETSDNPQQHTERTRAWIKEAGEMNQELVNCILSHNHTHNGFRGPQTLMEWALYTCDELTGFIVAVALVKPDKKLSSVDIKSVIKRFPEKAFAKPVDREQIKLCEEKLNIPLEEFAGITLKAMQGIAEEIGL